MAGFGGQFWDGALGSAVLGPVVQNFDSIKAPLSPQFVNYITIKRLKKQIEFFFFFEKM